MSFAHDTILLIEDDPNDVILLQRTISRFSLGRPMQVVSSGMQAISYLDGQGAFADREQHPLPTLVFLDLKLPDLSGFEVLTWVRQQARLVRTRVVVLTGSRKSLDVYRAYELGASSYLVKPVQPADIVGLGQSLNLPWLALAKDPKVTKAPPWSAARQPFDA